MFGLKARQDQIAAPDDQPAAALTDRPSLSSLRADLGDALRELHAHAARLDANGRRKDEMAALIGEPRRALEDLQAYKAAEAERLTSDPAAQRDAAELGLKMIRVGEARANAKFARQTLERLDKEHAELTPEHGRLALRVHERLVAVLAAVAADLAERQRAAELEAAKCASAIAAIRRSVIAGTHATEAYGPFAGSILAAIGGALSTEAVIARQAIERQAAAEAKAFAEPYGELAHRLQTDHEATVEEPASAR